MLLEDDACKALYTQLVAEGANLERVAVAEFDGLRGVMALKDLAPGDEIVAIPGPSAIGLGSQTTPCAALALLAAQEPAAAGERQAYCAAAAARAADLCPTSSRRGAADAAVAARHRGGRKALGDTAPSGDTSREAKGGCVSAGHVHSRVLTQGPAGSSSLNKLLIPSSTCSTTAPRASTT